MDHNINQGNVEWVVRRVNESLGNGQFAIGEVLLGIAEVTGRIITQMADTPVQGASCAQILVDHVKRTMVAGYTAKGYNMTEPS